MYSWSELIAMSVALKTSGDIADFRADAYAGTISYLSTDGQGWQLVYDASQAVQRDSA